MNEQIDQLRDPRHLDFLEQIGAEDAAGLKKAFQSYGPSWKSRGGVGAFMMLARKFDRLENGLKPREEDPSICRLGVMPYDIFRAATVDTRSEGVIDDIRDLRRYLMLVEAELRARGVAHGTHRDNQPANNGKPG